IQLTFIMQLLLLLFIASLACLTVSVAESFRRRLKRPAHGLVAYNSLTSGGHGSGRITRIADAAFTSRYLIAKPGSTGAHMAVGDAATMPLGIVLDEPAQGEAAAIALFGV